MEAIVLIFKFEDFHSPEITLDAEYIMEQLKDSFGYKKPNRIIRAALREDFLYIDNITEDQDFMLGLTEWGEEVWEDVEIGYEEIEE